MFRHKKFCMPTFTNECFFLSLRLFSLTVDYFNSGARLPSAVLQFIFCNTFLQKNLPLWCVSAVNSICHIGLHTNIYLLINQNTWFFLEFQRPSVTKSSVERKNSEILQENLWWRLHVCCLCADTTFCVFVFSKFLSASSKCFNQYILKTPL